MKIRTISLAVATEVSTRMFDKILHFGDETNLFSFNFASFKILGFSVNSESRSYNVYRLYSVLGIGILWILLTVDAVNCLNSRNFRGLSENFSTMPVHLLGLLRFICVVCSKKF